MGCSDETERLYQLREEAIIANLSQEKIQYITKRIRLCRQIDKTIESIDSPGKDLDLKDKWLGVKKNKKYASRPYVKSKHNGNPIPRHQVADFSAKQFKALLWTKNTEEGNFN